MNLSEAKDIWDNRFMEVMKMNNTVGKVLLAGLLGGIAVGATVYHAVQIYLDEGDKEDPVKVPSPEEPSAESGAEAAPEDIVEEAAPEDISDKAAEE